MDPITMALIFGGIGAGKAALIDGPAHDRDNRLQAEKTRYSPWTGMRGHDPEFADVAGQAIQGATNGYLLGAANKSAEAMEGMGEMGVAHSNASVNPENYQVQGGIGGESVGPSVPVNGEPHRITNPNSGPDSPGPGFYPGDGGDADNVFNKWLAKVTAQRANYGVA